MTSRVQLRVGTRSDPGLERPHNEDTFFADPALGIFAVIDGVGGQNAGEKAAELAAQELKARLSRPEGTVEQALREGIAFANNKIFQHAQLHPQHAGMACVLSAAVIDGNQLFIGHVGDSRAYKIRNGAIEKLTHDHSPIGEREDRGEISELEAMRHPRRNEVYRDVGSELHDPYDDDFIEIVTSSFELDAAILLCSDGLSDLVTSQRIKDTVVSGAGSPQVTAERLIQLALQEGGKDNVTVLVIEGPRFGGKTEGAETPMPRRAELMAETAPDRDEPTTRRIGVIAGEGQSSRARNTRTTAPGEPPSLVRPSAVRPSTPAGSADGVRTSSENRSQDLRQDDEPTSRLSGNRGDEVQRSFTVIRNPERKTGQLRSLSARTDGVDGPSSWVKGGRRGDEAEDRSGSAWGPGSEADGDNETERDGEHSRSGARVIQLPTSAQNVSNIRVSGRNERSDAGVRDKPAQTRSGADIARPWLSRLPPWALALILMVVSLAAFVGYLVGQRGSHLEPRLPGLTGTDGNLTAPDASPRVVSVLWVKPGQSIAEVLEKAEDGSVVLLPPGEFHERVTLRNRVTLAATEPGRTTLLPPDAATPGPVLEARGIQQAGVYGLVIGNSATPVSVGLLAEASVVRLVSTKFTGCQTACIQATGPTTRLTLQGVSLDATLPAIGTDLKEGARVEDLDKLPKP